MYFSKVSLIRKLENKVNNNIRTPSQRYTIMKSNTIIKSAHSATPMYEHKISPSKGKQEESQFSAGNQGRLKNKISELKKIIENLEKILQQANEEKELALNFNMILLQKLNEHNNSEDN